jgi:drug/metabolite transporter (DMT)-like permease
LTEWVVLALSGAMSFSILSVMEKVILSRWFYNSRSFCVTIGLIQVIIGLIISLFAPLSFADYWDNYKFAGISGFTLGLMLCSVYYSLRTLDISRVYSLLSSYPVSTALLASMILNEKLELLDWVAIILVAVGAGIATRAGNSNQSRLNHKQLALCLLVILAGVFYGSGEVAYKHALNMNIDGVDSIFWQLFVVKTLSVGLTLILLSVIWSPVTVIRDIKISLNSLESKVLVLFSQIVVAPFSVFLQVAAINLGPVSLVTALMASRPLFILGLSSFLSMPAIGILSEPLGGKMILSKLFAILMILSGVIIMTIGNV